jgi:hypothetical protein
MVNRGHEMEMRECHSRILKMAPAPAGIDLPRDPSGCDHSCEAFTGRVLE